MLMACCVVTTLETVGIGLLWGFAAKPGNGGLTGTVAMLTGGASPVSYVLERRRNRRARSLA